MPGVILETLVCHLFNCNKILIINNQNSKGYNLENTNQLRNTSEYLESRVYFEMHPTKILSYWLNETINI